MRFWLLDAAVEHGIPLDVLAAPNAGEVLNRKPHGHLPDQVASMLARMLDDGEVVFDGDLALQSEATAFTAARIAGLMNGPGRCSYRLTGRGGAEWEAWARPQWSRYTAGCERETIKAIGAATAGFAEELLGMEEYLNHQRAIVGRSIRRRTVRNWRATYWKTLPEGHLIAFRTRPLPRSDWSPMPHHLWARWVDLRRFYLRPADCGF